MRNGPLSLDDLLETLMSAAKKGVSTAHIAIGPRTFGSKDVNWDEDVSRFESAREREDVMADSASGEVSPLMVAIAAAEEDPAASLAADCESRVHAWFTGRFKSEYKTMRVAGKRPWPEFASAVKAARGLTCADVAAIHAVARAAVVCVGDDGALALPPRLLDASFDTEVIDAKTAQSVCLGAVASEALRRCANKVVDRAHALALDTRCPRNVLASKVAARESALAAFQAKNGT